MKDESAAEQVTAAVREGWMEGGSFLGSILSGTLLGLGLDWWLGTDPWLVIAGIILGSYAGLAGAWRTIKNQPDLPAVTLTHPDEVGS